MGGMRKVFMILLVSGCVAGAVERPNLVFILTDDQRYDTLGCTGNEIVKTPNIDRLAEQGTLFTQATVTSAICTPSRASYFTGMYERNHGINFNSGTSLSVEQWQNSYPMLLRDAGYHLGYIGKNHVPVGGAGYESGLIEASFDYWYAMHKHLYFYPKEHEKIPGIDDGMFDNAGAENQIDIIQEGMDNFFEPNEKFYNGAMRFLRERPGDRPFCLSICLNLPHDCGTERMESRVTDPDLYRSGYYEVRDEIRSRLPETYVAKDDLKQPKLPEDLFYTQYRQGTYNYVNTTDELTDRIIRRYQALTGIDQLVGKLLGTLKEKGLAENTVIIFASDHGLFRGEFGLGGKSMCYDSNLHIPLIVFDPRVDQKGQRRDEAVQSIDVTTTLLDYAEARIPEHMSGKSLKPLVQGEIVPWREYAFSENLWSTRFGNPRCESVRSKDWKYIRYFKNDRMLYDMNVDKRVQYKVSGKQAELYQTWLDASIKGEQPVYEELFDLNADPDESVNLALDPIFGKKLKELRDVCQAMVKEARGIPHPVVNLETERREYLLYKMRHD